MYIHSLDREVDLISPLVTPLTYEGLIDDTVGIEKGRVRLDAAVLGSAEQQDAMSVKMAAQSGAGPEAAAAAGKTPLCVWKCVLSCVYFCVLHEVQCKSAGHSSNLAAVF